MNTEIEMVWIARYQQKGALWIHDGNRLRPHALLSAGGHSNGFFNSRLIIPDDELMRLAAKDLMDLVFDIDDETDYLMLVDRIVGPQTGATKLAQMLSEDITEWRGMPCTWASPAKHEEGSVRTMVFDDPEQMGKVLPAENNLLCEDVVTTAASVELARQAVIQAGGVPFDLVLALVNRSGLTELNGRKIVALINRKMMTWTAEECPLCKVGSKAIPAKDPVNWARLNAQY